MSLIHEKVGLGKNDPLFLSGSNGGYTLQQLGEVKYPDELVHTNPEWVSEVHRRYISRGVRGLLTFSFGLNGRERTDLTEPEIFDRNREAVRLARQAVGNRNIAVIASMGPLMGELIEDEGKQPGISSYVPFADAVRWYRTQASGLMAGDPDLLLGETLNDPNSVRALLRAIAEARTDMHSDVPVAITMSFDRHSAKKMGWVTGHGVTAAELVALTNDHPEVIAIGANCGSGYDRAEEIMQDFTAARPVRAALWSKMNAGKAELDAGERTVWRTTPEKAGQYAVNVYDAGARFIGGCCGTDPELTGAIINAPIPRQAT